MHYAMQNRPCTNLRLLHGFLPRVSGFLDHKGPTNQRRWRTFRTRFYCISLPLKNRSAEHITPMSEK